MLIPLGILASSGGAAAGAYELISTTVLGAQTASVTFSSIVSTYKHLQIRMTGRLAGGGDNPRPFLMRFNGSSSAEYANHRLYGNGGLVGSAAAVNANEISFDESMPTSSHAADIFNAVVIDILDYANTSKYKTSRALIGYHTATQRNIALHSGLRRSTEAISSITIADNNGFQFVAGSRFSLYGIKG